MRGHGHFHCSSLVLLWGLVCSLEYQAVAPRKRKNCWVDHFHFLHMGSQTHMLQIGCVPKGGGSPSTMATIMVGVFGVGIPMAAHVDTCTTVEVLLKNYSLSELYD